MKPYRIHHCRGCRKDSRQVYTHTDNGIGRSIENWRCVECAMGFVTMGNVPDGEGLCLTVVRQWLKRNRGFIHDRDVEELEARLLVDLVRLYRAQWKPEKCPSFLAFATTGLKNAIIDWYRVEYERGGRPKAHANALSLDAPRSSGVAETIGDEFAARRGREQLPEQPFDVAALTARSRLFFERVLRPAYEEGLTLEEAARRHRLSRAELLRMRQVVYDEIREQAAA